MINRFLWLMVCFVTTAELAKHAIEHDRVGVLFLFGILACATFIFVSLDNSNNP